MHPSKLALVPSPTVAHSLRPSSIEGHPIYYGPKSNAFIRQAFQRDDQVERKKGWKMLMEEKKRFAYGRVKKKKKKSGQNVEMQTDGVLRSSLVSLDYESYQKSYQKLFSLAGRSPQARSLPTLSANGYLWMHQSTPPLPGFNAIRIDYIDFSCADTQPSVVLAKLPQRVNEPLHLMISLGSHRLIFESRVLLREKEREKLLRYFKIHTQALFY